MSLKTKFAIMAGLTDVDKNFTRLYNIGFEIQKAFDFDEERSILMTNIKDYTHVNYPRLKFLYDIATQLAKSKTKGAFVETGVWKGGCAGILSYVSKKYDYKHPLYFFDSFEGLPEPTTEDGKDAKAFSEHINSEGNLVPIHKVSAGKDYIERLLYKKLQIEPQKVHIIKGWFQHTLPIYKEKIGEIALLRLDGDWYESTKTALENLYDNVVTGGYIVIDDYNYWDGCKTAVDEFLKSRGINVQIKPQDTSGVYFQKP
jgi:hypothetical protein